MTDGTIKDGLNYRYERKFLISGLNSYEVESNINLHPAMFSEIFQKRSVNNIYFDSPELNNYFDNIDGNSRRKKIRIRWYDKLFGEIEKPILEIKIKNGLLGRKSHYPLHPIILDSHFNMQNISQIIKNNKIPENLKMELKSLRPTLLNRYNRKYFLSNDKRYRITIDTDQVFYQIGCWSNSFEKILEDKTNIILELKYGMDSDNNANQITNHFSFRSTKNSKYVTGIQRVYE